MILLPQRVPIPERFHSDEKDAPFAHCLQCDRPLLKGDPTEYLVEKAYRRYDAYDVEETIFEYALCIECHREMAASFSDLSRKRCNAYFAERVDLDARIGALLSGEAVEVGRWMKQCVAHGTPAGDLEEYQVLAHCVGNEMVLSHLPLLIGGPAMEEVAECLSAETRDELGGFRDDHFGVPPELQTAPQSPALA
jgi:hypothetical protein